MKVSNTNVFIEKIRIECADGVPLAARLLLPVHRQVRGVVQINSASATKKEYYHSFASYLAENGFAALYYDNRGVCESQPPKGLRGCEFTFLDWGLKDIPAVIRYLKGRFPHIPLVVVGHSAGGQLMGLPPNLYEVAGLLTVGTGSGYWGNMEAKARSRVRFFFGVVRPVTHALFGYTAAKRLGIMEDIPYRVTNAWRDWCSRPSYFFDEQYYPDIQPFSHYKALPFEVDVCWASDDYTANDANTAAFWSHVKSLREIRFHRYTPEEFLLKKIDHFGFFPKAFRNTLWPQLLKKIENYLPLESKTEAIEG